MTNIKPIFTKLIKCTHCGSNFKSRIEKGKRKYVCSNYDNYGKCIRIPVDEDYLLELIEHRYDKELSREEVREVVDYIEIFDKQKTKEDDIYKLTIHFKNDIPIILDDNYWQF